MDSSAQIPGQGDGDGDGDGEGSGDGDAAGDGDSGMPAPGTGTIAERLLASPWTALSWTPARCKAQLATDLSMLDPLVWKAASGSASVCATLDTEELSSDYGWGDSEGGNRISYVIDPDGNGPMPKDRADVFYDATGAPQFAIRYASGCGFNRVLNGEETCWSSSFYEAQTPFESFLGCGGELSAPAQVFEWDKPASAWGVSDDLVVVITSGAPSAVVFDRANPTGARTVLMQQGNILRNLFARDSNIIALATFVDATDDGQGLLRSENVDPWQALYDPKPRVVWKFAAHEDRVAWLEADSLSGVEGRPSTLYVGSWPASGAPLSGKQMKVITSGSDDRFLLRDDYLARTTVADVRLHRLSDNKEWIVPLPAGLMDGLFTDLWLDDSYVTYLASDMQPGTPTVARVLVRCPIAEIVKEAGI